MIKKLRERAATLGIIAPTVAGLLLWLVGDVLNLDWWWYGAIACALISFYLMYGFGLTWAAGYVLPIESNHESLAHARAMGRAFASGQKMLLAVVREGKEMPGADGKPRPPRQGPGAILIDSTSAAALFTNTGFSRILGPGLHFARNGERIGLIVDLRLQRRTREIEAQTRDGIWIKCKLVVRFQIDGVISRRVQELDRNLEPWPEPYVWSQRHIRRALSLERSGPERQQVPWDEVVADEAVKRLHVHIAQYTLDELTEPRNPLIDRRDDIRRQLEGELKAEMARQGIRVLGLRVSQFVPRDKEVNDQRLESWQSEWVRRKKVIEAEGEAESRRKLELARAQAQMDTMTRMIEALDASYRAGANNADLIALRFLEVLESLAKDPETQKTLDQVRRKLLVGGGASSGAASPT